MNFHWLERLTGAVPFTHWETFPRLMLSMLLGAVIGAERQWRQRAAGLRTTTLVCFGAATFADLGATMLGRSNNNIVAYVVSGVGFLGAGAIMKEGGSIRGLNTAATLWCSAAVGACAGTGEPAVASYATVLLVSINLIFRPVSRWIDKRSTAHLHGIGIYRLVVTSQKEKEEAVSGAVMRALGSRSLILRELRTEEIEGSAEAIIEAVVESKKRDDSVISGLATQLKSEGGVIGSEWAETSHEID